MRRREGEGRGGGETERQTDRQTGRKHLVTILVFRKSV